MRVIRIDHIGIAVNSVEDMLGLYTDALGLELRGIDILVDQKVRTAILQVGENQIELLESMDTEGPIARHIKKRGEGLHHLALEVDDIEGALEMLEKKEVPLVDSKPRAGVEDTRIAFLHPGEAKVLLELVETAK